MLPCFQRGHQLCMIVTVALGERQFLRVLIRVADLVQFDTIRIGLLTSGPIRFQILHYCMNLNSKKISSYKYIYHGCLRGRFCTARPYFDEVNLVNPNFHRIRSDPYSW
jgi:hypothetical protein